MIHEVKRSSEQNGAHDQHSRKPEEGAQDRDNLRAGKVVRAPRPPPGFKQDGQANQPAAGVDCRFAPRGLFRTAASQLSDNDIGINRGHGDALLPP